MFAQYYKLRPDIFIQRAPGKLRIKRNEENYILSLNNDFIDIVLDFLEKADGKYSLENILSDYQGAIRESLRKISGFLVSKNLAFFQKEEQKLLGDSVALVEDYLSQYADDTRQAYHRFNQQSFMVIASDLELFSLTRTLAEYGAMDVSFANLNKAAVITSEDVVSNFRRCRIEANANIAPVSVQELLKSKHSVVITTDVNIVEQLQRLPAVHRPLVYFASFGDNSLVVQKPTMETVTAAHIPTNLPNPCRTARLIAGAVMGSVIFDDLTGVKSFSNHEYLHYQLDGCNLIKKSPFFDLQSIEHRAQHKDQVNVLHELKTLLDEPLFPVKACQRAEQPVDMINIQAIRIVPVDCAGEEAGSAETHYYGIGFEESSARVDALQSFVLTQHQWFANDIHFSTLQDSVASFNAMQWDVAKLLNGASQVPLHSNRQNEFLMFCIKAVFDAVVSFHIARGDNREYMLASAAGETVYSPLSDEKDDLCQRLLLRLYLNLWLKDNRRSALRQSAVSAKALFQDPSDNTGDGDHE